MQAMPQTDLEPNGLGRLVPISLLRAPEHLQLLWQKARFEDLPGRRRLSQADEHHALIYVVSGQVVLHSAAGAQCMVGAGTERACAALFSHPGDIAIAAGPARIVRIDRELVEILLAKERSNASQVSEVDLSLQEGQLVADIYSAHLARQLRIPALPEVALRVRDAVQRDDTGVSDVVTIVRTDPVIAGRLMQAANSAMYGGLEQAGTLLEAITRLGLGATRNLILALVLRQLFRARAPLIADFARSAYQHSAQVAALASALAATHPGCSADEALLAGLVHDIGAIPVLCYADDLSALAANRPAVLRAIDKLRGPIGALVLSDWGFERRFVHAAEHADDWWRDAAPEIDLCDLVIAAQLHLAGQNGRSMAPKLADTPAGRKLGAGEDGLPAAVLNEAAVAIAASRELLLA